MASASIPVSTSQVVVVNSDGGVHADVTACQREGGAWISHIKPYRSTIGGGGVAPLGTKKEGDKKTPAGLYLLGDAFGTQPLALKMDYKYITPEDKFIDDSAHKDYNCWVSGSTDAKSYENMLIPSYRMGVVVNYNMNPIIPGAGSAIFMHVWEAENKPSHGCITTDEKHMNALLQWLDKRQNPYVYIR